MDQERDFEEEGSEECDYIDVRHDCGAAECVTCGKSLGLNDDDGLDYCSSCLEHDGEDWGNRTRACFYYAFDASVGKAGGVWEGMPENPEPYIDWDEVPIFKEHPDLQSYKDMLRLP